MECPCRPLEGHSKAKTNGQYLRSAGGASSPPCRSRCTCGLHAVASPVRLLRLGAAPRVPSLVWAAPPPGSPSSRVRRAAARARGRGDRDVAAAIACKRVPRGAALDGPPRHGPVSGVDGHLQRGLRRAHGLGRARHGAALLLPGAALSLSKSLGVCSPLCFTKRGAGLAYPITFLLWRRHVPFFLVVATGGSAISWMARDEVVQDPLVHTSIWRAVWRHIDRSAPCALTRCSSAQRLTSAKLLCDSQALRWGHEQWPRSAAS